MPVFRAPGLADPNVSEVALQAWNERIVDELQRHPPSPILVADPKLIPDGAVSNGVKWPAHPLEPMNCFDEETAAQLCDWGWAGRAELHNEYLEYGLVMRPDQTGRLRPKRFIATTELMEWWQTMAVHDPEHFLGSIEEITGSRPEHAGIVQCNDPVMDAARTACQRGALPTGHDWCRTQSAAAEQLESNAPVVHGSPDQWPR
ncbi:hypothetical protein ABH975_006861 [Bradyrhizobium ottawaense]|uniref:hypothetical protein n=1 Tax=Bradyrhizobium ottawaense TaxID=931866 RepID=UPI0035163D6D